MPSQTTEPPAQSSAAISGAVAQHTVVTDQELMDKLRDAAPAAVLKGAAILNMGADGQMKVIQVGTRRRPRATRSSI